MAKTEEKIRGNGHSRTAYEWEPVNKTGEHKSSDEIEHDIEETRHTMDTILDTLSGRFDTHNIMDRFFQFFQKEENRDRAKLKISEIGSNVSDSFQKNPLPMVLMTTGAVWMVWQSRQPSTPAKPSQGPSAGEKIEEKIGEEAQKVKGKISSEEQKLKEKQGQTAQQNEEKMEHYQKKGEEIKEQGKTYSKELLNKTDSALHENPLLYGAAALFGGMLVGMLVPETKKEKQVIGEKKDELQEKPLSEDALGSEVKSAEEKPIQEAGLKSVDIVAPDEE